jgi:hypothetical protein
MNIFISAAYRTNAGCGKTEHCIIRKDHLVDSLSKSPGETKRVFSCV